MTEQEIWGVHHEVVVSDCYKLKELTFIPDVIFDIGANIGIFAQHAHELFPTAKIVSFEPDEKNVEQFICSDTILVKKALGHGRIYKYENIWGGAQECYHSSMFGYSKDFLEKSKSYKDTGLEGITLDTIVNKYLSEGERFILKIDCEGAENAIFDHEPSMNVMKKADYIAMELHYFSQNGNIREITDNILNTFKSTHDCRRITNMFYATKKENK